MQRRCLDRMITIQSEEVSVNKWLYLIVAAALTMAPVAALASSTAAPAQAAAAGISLELGQNDFRTYCAACHGVGARGDGTVAEFLTIAAPDLTRLSKLNSGKFPNERVMGVIDGRAEVKVHGPRDMPVWGDWFNLEASTPGLSKEARETIVHDRISSLMTYLESIQER